MFNCRLCGYLENAQYMEPTKSRLLETQLCFHCNFWMEKVRWREEADPRSAVVNGKHYRIGKDPKPGERRALGFGGQRFVIAFNDGRVVETGNLWAQGEIPPRFRDRLTDNARFLTDLEIKAWTDSIKQLPEAAGSIAYSGGKPTDR